MNRQGSGPGRGAQGRASGAAYADGDSFATRGARDPYLEPGAYPVDPGHQDYARGTGPRPADLPPGPARSRQERGMPRPGYPPRTARQAGYDPAADSRPWQRPDDAIPGVGRPHGRGRQALPPAFVPRPAAAPLRRAGRARAGGLRAAGALERHRAVTLGAPRGLPATAAAPQYPGPGYPGQPLRHPGQAAEPQAWPGAVPVGQPPGYPPAPQWANARTAGPVGPAGPVPPGPGLGGMAGSYPGSAYPPGPQAPGQQVPTLTRPQFHAGRPAADGTAAVGGPARARLACRRAGTEARAGARSWPGTAVAPARPAWVHAGRPRLRAGRVRAGPVRRRSAGPGPVRAKPGRPDGIRRPGRVRRPACVRPWSARVRTVRSSGRTAAVQQRPVRGRTVCGGTEWSGGAVRRWAVRAWPVHAGTVSARAVPSRAA